MTELKSKPLHLSLFLAMLLPATAVLADGHNAGEPGSGPYPHPRADLSDEQRAAMRARMKEHREKMAGRHIGRLDTNEDGKVDLAEFLANAEQRFSEMDGDGDGYVTPEEAQRKHRELRQRQMERNQKRHQKRIKKMEELEQEDNDG